VHLLRVQHLQAEAQTHQHRQLVEARCLASMPALLRRASTGCFVTATQAQASGEQAGWLAQAGASTATPVLTNCRTPARPKFCPALCVLLLPWAADLWCLLAKADDVHHHAKEAGLEQVAALDEDGAEVVAGPLQLACGRRDETRHNTAHATVSTRVTAARAASSFSACCCAVLSQQQAC
jgi:hypothetical protein